MGPLDHFVRIIGQVGFPAALVLLLMVLAPRYALHLLEVFRKIMDDFAEKLVSGMRQVNDRHESVVNRAEMLTSRQEAAVWQDEQALIKIAAAKYGLDWHFVAAIRKAENGGPGREFGVLSVKAPTYPEQLDVCCVTVRHRLVEYDGGHQALDLYEAPDGRQAVVYHRGFISHFAAIWAPGGAANDPRGLNTNWVRNVSYWYLHLIDLDHPA